MKSVYLLIFVCLFSIRLFAQNIPVGGWRTHLTYHNTKLVEKVGSKVYCASANGLFYIDTETLEMETVTKVDGLSGSVIGDMAYHEELGKLVIAYKTGNIDVLEDGHITNVRTILNSSFTEKEIFEASISGDFVLLSTAFGVVKLNLKTYKIKETYSRLGRTGESVPVYSIWESQDSIYLSTSEGLTVAPSSEGVNKQDFRNWSFKTSLTVGSRLLGIENDLYVVQPNMGVYGYEEGELVALFQRNDIVNIADADGDLWVFADNGQVYSEEQGFSSMDIEGTVSPRDMVSVDGEFWLADEKAGLLMYNGEETNAYFPLGTLEPEVYRLFYFDNKIVALRGGWDNGARNLPAAFYLFEDGKWKNYTSENTHVGAVSLPDIHDLTGFAYNPVNQKGYFTSYGDGLVEWDIQTDEFVRITAPFGLRGDGEVRLHSVVVDGVGDLWIASDRVVYRVALDGSSDSFSVSSLVNPLDIILDEAAQLWCRLSSGNILVFQNGKVKTYGEGVGNGNLPSRTILSLANDREGSVWLGTSEGVAEFFNPFSALTEQAEDAVLPRFEGSPLLGEDRITAIAVDGGNRKWLGTEGGLWLVAADGSKVYHHFTAENSPLLSDNINSLAIHPTTGEVFIGTDAGIVSYRSDATDVTVPHQDVKVFPNPFYVNKGGIVTVSGLVEDAYVKITDISGKLIWETKAYGGTATWNGMNYNGSYAKTGVYLIFSTEEEGEESYVAKVAIIH